MKQFFGAFFGSVIGIIIATVLAVVIVIGAVKSSIKDTFRDGEETSVVKNNSILKITLHGDIVDRETDNPFAALKGMKDFAGDDELGLNMLLKKIKQAKTDDKIKGIYLHVKHFHGGFANITELRNALIDFKKSGKFIYSYSEAYGQKEYYLASAASKIFVNPQGALEFKGLSMNLMFYKNALEKLGVDLQVFRHGKYKSAVEPYLLDKMSEANRHQSEVFLNSVWNTVLQGIAAERKVSETELNEMANNLSIAEPADAKGKLVDVLAYEDEVLSEMKKKTGVAEKDKLNFTEFQKYKLTHKTDVKLKDSQIAVIYASGDIKSGDGDSDDISSERLVKSIREARMDDKIKAIVLRVNSPGGSALASEVIWREVTLAKKSKPVVVSMGNFAASGGYYISCAATRIFAQPNTITGSIGVFGIIPNFQKALQDKLGITMDTVNTNKHSHIGSTMLPINEREHGYIQKSVEKIYDVFTTRVADGRKLSKAMVDSIGQGRVWTGNDAVKINLVDEIGGLDAAVAYAAKLVNMKEFKLIELPKHKHPFEELLGHAEEEAEARVIQRNLGETYSYLKYMKNIISLEGIQARLPFELLIK
jgi:protease-4